MKKNLLFLLMGCMTFNILQAQLIIKKVSSPPVIDGTISSDDPWALVGDFNNIKLPAENSTTNFTAQFKICYDDNNIYTVLVVKDTTLHTSSSSPWQNDETEFFFGMDTVNISGGYFTTGDYQLRKQRDKAINSNGFDGEFDDGTWNSTAINGSSKSDFLNNSNFKIAETDNGKIYTQEWQIPIKLLTKGLTFTNGIPPTTGGTGWDGVYLRFDAQVGNNYDGSHSARLFYHNNSNLDYNYASNWGIAKFEIPIEDTIITGLKKALALARDSLSHGKYSKYDTTIIKVSVIDMQAVTSIINLSGTDVTIKMFPNPVTDQLTLEATSNIEKYEVYTFSGSLYETKNVNLLSTQIDVMSYPVGTFLMKIYTQYGTISNKLIIQK